MHSVSIVGCGYTGLRVVERWLKLHHRVCGFGARVESLARIAATGAEARVLNLDRALTAPVDFDDHVVYYTVPPAATGDRDERLERLLEHIAGAPRRLVYLSTTGVYGDRRGALVDEETPPAPTSARAVRRLAAENRIRSWADYHAISWCILRLPGIYGPGRLPLDRLRDGRAAIDLQEAGPGNRIHVEDLATVCVAAGRAPCADGRIYNVTDGNDESMTAYLQRVARLGGLPVPPLISRAQAQASYSASSWSFVAESRRVDNRRMLRELGVRLAFEDLDEGISASL